MFQNSWNKPQNTEKWQFELCLFLNKWGEYWVLWMLCAKLTPVTISPSPLNMARRVHWFPASQATLLVRFLTSNVNFSFKAAGTNAAHRLSLVPIPETGQLALENKLRGEKGNLCHLTNTMCQNVFPFTLTEVLEHLEKQSTHPAYFSLLLNKYFKILIYNSDCEQNSSARADGPEEVGQHWQGANAQPTERSCSGDIPRRQNRVRREWWKGDMS